MNFLDFVSNKKQISESKVVLNEALQKKNVDKSLELILKLFKKNIDGIVVMDKHPYEVTSNGKKCLAYEFLQIKNKVIECAWLFNYLIEGESAEVYSIDFFDKADAEELLMNPKGAKTTISLFTMGSSIVYFLPVVYHIVNEKDYDLSQKEAKELTKKVVKESKAYSFWVGAKEYIILEGLTDNQITESFKMVTEMDSELAAHRWATKAARDDAYKKRKEDPETFNKLKEEYEEILKAIRGGAQTMGDLRVAMKKGVKVTVDDKSIKDAEEQVKKQKEDPEVAFKKMQVYLKSVITNQQPGTIICGAPGIGKTYRVTHYLEDKGYKNYDDIVSELEDSEEDKEIIINATDKVYIQVKGTCSPRQLYVTLYKFREANNIIVVDDADALVGPQAPEVAINIFKAALDSNSSPKGRLVTYMVAGELHDGDDIIPKRMHFKGGVIVLTNHGVGELNKALKGRVFTQTIDFDSEQVLQLIEGLLDVLGGGTISKQSKQKALDYLRKLAKDGVQMQISIRSFIAAARLYELTEDEDLKESEVEEMIAEQMKNQANTSKKHF